MSPFIRPLLAGIIFVACMPAHAQNGVELASTDGFWQINLRPSAELIGWSSDVPAPALNFYDDDVFLDPRFKLSLDAAAGSHWFLHLNSQLDRGFDPGSRADGDFRVDEIFLRFRPTDDQRLNFQIGKFPTVFGSWIAQHDFFDDPFLLPPLPYSQIVGVNVRTPAATSPAAMTARSAGKAPSLAALSKENWASLIWGPSYATGASIFGSTEHLDYAFEIKNAALSSHPDAWFPAGDDFENPTFTGRIGYRPDAAWAFGLSASRGPYFTDDAANLLPQGKDRGDFQQSTVGLDARWASGSFILSGEVIGSEFETPSSGDLRTLAWFLQARWKVAPGIWLAGRFGQMVANQADGLNGRATSWSPDVWRAELGAGWRITNRMLLKVDYSFTHSDNHQGGEHLFGLGFGIRL